MATVNNLAPAKIADVLGTRSSVVRSVLSRARREGHNIPLFGSAPGTVPEEINTMVRGDNAEALRVEAGRRGISTSHLTAMLLNAALHDDMINAILDDET